MGHLIAVVILLGFLGTMAYGWILNFMYLINLEVFIITFKTIIGVIGIFVPPIGAIMGLFIW